MLKKIRLVLAVIISFIVLSFSLSFFCFDRIKYTNKENFNDNENRYMEILKSFSFEGLKNNEYSKSLERWFGDYFPLRNEFMNLKAVSEILFGKLEINGVYIAKDGFLIEKPTEINVDTVNEILNNFANKLKRAKASLMLVPTAITIYSDKLPHYADDGNEIRDICSIYARASKYNTIDATSYLMEAAEKDNGSERDNKLYYKTDHHWTTLGAYYAYLAYCDNMNLKPYKLEDFSKVKLSSNFKGTVFSKINDERDGEYMYDLKGEKQNLRVTYSDKKGIFSTIYNKEYLQKKDKYSYYLNNIHPLMTITNEDSSSKDELCIIKDSYANCFIPFLTSYYKKIYVIDPRYFKDSQSDFINNHKKIKDVLILYNTRTMNDDFGFRGID